MVKRLTPKRAAVRRWRKAIAELEAYCRNPDAKYSEYERLNTKVIEAEADVSWLIRVMSQTNQSSIK